MCFLKGMFAKNERDLGLRRKKFDGDRDFSYSYIVCLYKEKIVKNDS